MDTVAAGAEVAVDTAVAAAVALSAGRVDTAAAGARAAEAVAVASAVVTGTKQLTLSVAALSVDLAGSC